MDAVTLTCTLCQFTFSPRRGYPADLWKCIDKVGLPVTWPVPCSNCNAELDVTEEEGQVSCAHFVDYPEAPK